MPSNRLRADEVVRILRRHDGCQDCCRDDQHQHAARGHGQGGAAIRTEEPEGLGGGRPRSRRPHAGTRVERGVAEVHRKVDRHEQQRDDHEW